MIWDKLSKSCFDKSVKIIENHEFDDFLNRDFTTWDKSSKS